MLTQIKCHMKMRVPVKYMCYKALMGAGNIRGMFMKVFGITVDSAI